MPELTDLGMGQGWAQVAGPGDQRFGAGDPGNLGS